MTALKHCPDCNQWKEATTANFAIDKKSKDGCYYICKACKIIIAKAYYRQNKESIKAKQRQNYAAWLATQPPKSPKPPKLPKPLRQLQPAKVKVTRPSKPEYLLNPTTEIELTMKEFLLAKRQERLSVESVRQYTLRLGEFAGWLAGRGVTCLSDLSRLLLREWAVSLNPDWSPATTRNTITILKGFLNWCYAEDLITDAKLATALRLPKVKLRAQRTLTAVEVQKLLDACDTTMAGLRDAAIIALMVDSGLRASEVSRLKVDDLVFNFPIGDKRVNLLQVIGKGGNQKPVYFSDTTADRLRAWLEVRVAHAGVEALFVSQRGYTWFSRGGLYQALRDLGNRANVPGVTPHSLRRTFAVLMIEGGAPTRVVQMLGRWSSLLMVERYTQALEVGTAFAQYAAMDYVSREGGNL